MPFLVFMIFGTLLIASAAVFFSVLGLVQTFSETAIYWGTAIEIAKLTLASFLYRYWDKSNKISKFVNISLVAFLMTITSLGIYGHIITSYQEGNLQVQNQSIKLDAETQKLDRIYERITIIDERIESNKDRINDIEYEISQVPDNYVTVRRELIQEREPEKQNIQNRIDTLFDERDTLFDSVGDQQQVIALMRMESGEIENKIGPIMFVVETLGATGEKAVFWFVLIIVLSFDPAAVALTVYTNKVALERDNPKPPSNPEIPLVKGNSDSVEDDSKTTDILQALKDIASKVDARDERYNRLKETQDDKEPPDNNIS